MTQTTQIRQENPDETDSMASIEHPDNDVYGYLSREVADQLGEYMELTLSEEAEVEASLDTVTGKGSGNYARYETPGGAVVGFGISLDVLEEVFDIEVERDENGVVQNAPESVGMVFAPSTEDDYEEAQATDEEEAEALVAGVSDESDEEEEVEISDEEIGLVE